eukprot:gene6494-6722_t
MYSAIAEACLINFAVDYWQLQLINDPVQGNDTVLELGCSYGLCTNVLSQHAQQVVGVDNSELVIAEGSAQGCAMISKAPPAAATTEGEVVHADSWWKALEFSRSLNNINNVGKAEPWFLAARAAGFKKNPLRMPQRFLKDGTRICRPHNYDRCFKVDTCEFDHRHCHHCGMLGHRAVACPVVM